MKINYFESGSLFPFCVPSVDGGSVPTGAGTPYPAGFSLDQAMQIYWRAQNYQLSISGTCHVAYMGGDTLDLVFSATSVLVKRNAPAPIQAHSLLADGFAPTGPSQLVCGWGATQEPTINATWTGAPGAGGTGSGAMETELNLFISNLNPLVGLNNPYPMVRSGGLWWPVFLFDASIVIANSDQFGGGFDFDANSLAEPGASAIGALDVFGQSVPLYFGEVDPSVSVTASVSGSLTITGEWP